MNAAPPGWPADLPAPADGFAEQVTDWLLDRLPPEYRTSPMRQHPMVLGLAALRHSTATLEGVRETYRQLRTELRDLVPPEQIDAGLLALEAMGAEFARNLREVELVYEAMCGQRWRPRL